MESSAANPAATCFSSGLQAFTTLASFNGTNGSSPYAGLVQATNGDFYGTTFNGAEGGGTVFKITPSGVLTTLYSFCSQSGCTYGDSPLAALVQATDANLYGTTYEGGAANYGVFRITPGGTLTTLYSFCSQSGCTDGAYPNAALVLATNGALYGTTSEGGAANYGTVFKITPGGTLTTLYTFCSQSGCTDGINPNAGLVQATNGNLYGTTFDGGAANEGTVFKITPNGTLTTLYSFCSRSGCTDGEHPTGLVQATNGNLHGTTFDGGAEGSGTVFKITPSGALTTLYNFCSQSGCTDGYSPRGKLVQATDGNLYGTTVGGGVSALNHGTIFRITPNGTLTTLYGFCSQSGCIDGAYPIALIQATDGNLYGTTESDWPNDDGTVFSLYVGLSPFVETLPTSGKVGVSVKDSGNKPDWRDQRQL
jgi:uncharacterized repeat protein (TIGR03803 family)